MTGNKESSYSGLIMKTAIDYYAMYSETSTKGNTQNYYYNDIIINNNYPQLYINGYYNEKFASFGDTGNYVDTHSTHFCWHQQKLIYNIMRRLFLITFMDTLKLMSWYDSINIDFMIVWNHVIKYASTAIETNSKTSTKGKHDYCHNNFISIMNNEKLVYNNYYYVEIII